MNEKEIDLLLKWYEKNKRDLPWRHTTDSYKIWISEVMLQQTRVEAVKFYYERFINRLPTIKDLAVVDDDTLLKLWEGLGYYSRARNLKACAKTIMNEKLDNLPSDEKSLKKLPGIGPYTTGAILSIAYQKCVPAIDGNVMRILSRVYEDKRDLLKKKVQEEYKTLLQKLMKKGKTREFTEGFIELGALVCLPNGAPKCTECPFKNICLSYKHQTMLEYPIKKTPTKRKIVNKTVYVLEYNKTYAIAKRKNDGLLKGLYELPNMDEALEEEALKNVLEKKNICIKEIQKLGKFKHIFSHIEWHMNAYIVECNNKDKTFSYHTKKEIEEDYSLPTAFQKVFRTIK